MASPRVLVLGAALVALTACPGPVCGAKSEPVEIQGRQAGEMRRSSDWTSTAAVGSAVPADIFAMAMTSLAPHYRDDREALQKHLEEEHAIFMAETPDDARAYLCCTDYANGPAVKSALESACGGKRFVRTALNNYAHGAYCALAHMSAAAAAEAHSLVHGDARCSPVTHASKEPFSLVAPSVLSGDGASRDRFGLSIAASLQEGIKRGLVITMSPGSLPINAAASETRPGRTGVRGGGERRNLAAAEDKHASSALNELEERWRAFWGDTQGHLGGMDLAQVVPWTGYSRGSDGSFLPYSDAASASEGLKGRAQEFHNGKAVGYREALQHLGEVMEAKGTLPLSEACGWDANMSFVHGRNDLLYIRGVHHEDHDEDTAAACFLALVGFLSAQPEVMHIHPEARIEALNRVLTAYVEGGGSTEKPMSSAGLDGSGEVIGVSDTGLDDNSCFFKDENGSVPRTTMSDAEVYPDQRKVIQYVAFADGMDSDGHGTHVSGIAAGEVYDLWEQAWEDQVSHENCEDEDLVRSCFGDCVKGMAGPECNWNPELACPMSGCDDDYSCDEDTGYTFPCFDDPVDELPDASGMAPKAKLAFFDIGTEEEGLIIPDDIGGMWDAQYAAGARIMSNSWSLVTMTEPTSRDVQLDEWIHANPDAFVVFGAGNNGYVDGSFNPGSVQSPATAKTAMTVGASNSGPDRAYAYYLSVSSNYAGVKWVEDDVSFKVSPYSARGPVGRFTAKPDVVAPGLMVHSAKASLSEEGEETCALDSLGGTSMAAPAIAGAAALVRQYFRDGVLASYLDGEGLCEQGGAYEEAGMCEAFEPSGYLVKAVLVNSAEWLGNMQTVSWGDKVEWMTVVDFAQGFGAVQMASGIPTVDAPIGAFYHDIALESEALYYYLIYVSDANKDLSVTVAWYDPPGSVTSYNLLHDLDIFAMEVDTRRYFRSNSYNTMQAMCEEDESCAEKYEFTFDTHLADFMNPVERIFVPSTNLSKGYYVLGVRSRLFTESDTQTYGMAAVGGGLVLHDMSDDWGSLGGSAPSAGDGLGAPPDPDGVGQTMPTPAPLTKSSSPTPFPTLAAESSTPSPTLAAESSTPSPTLAAESSTATMRPMTAAPTDSDADPGGKEVVIDGSNPTPSPTVGDPDDALEDATTGDDGFGQSSTRDSSMGTAGYDAIGGDEEEGENPESDFSGGGDEGEGGWTSKSKVAVAASVAGAVVLMGVGMCFAKRRRKGETHRDESGSFLHPRSSRPSHSKVADAHSDDEGEGGGSEEDKEEKEDVGGEFFDGRGPSGRPHLPGYATAVASVPEETGTAILRSSSGSEEVVELGAGDTSEVSAFYAAVDPVAVSKLVEWGISRDFARVALRQKGNSVPEALQMIAGGDMDEQLAMDHEEMAREGAAEAAKVEAAAAAAEQAAAEAAVFPAEVTATDAAVENTASETAAVGVTATEAAAAAESTS